MTRNSEATGQRRKPFDCCYCGKRIKQSASDHTERVTVNADRTETFTAWHNECWPYDVQVNIVKRAPTS